jgi:predicted Fe-Mo cluster-binding NifX family protein
MKIAVAATGPTLDAEVERRLGLCSYLLVVDTKSLDFKAVPVPDVGAGHGSGLKVVALALAEEARVILAGHVSPDIARTLRRNGVEIVTSVSGSAREAVERYRRGEVERGGVGGSRWAPASSLKRSARQLASILPVLFGVVLLVGLFKTFVSGEVLLSVFSGEPLPDTFLGACFGSILAGNPVNSYVIGDSLLEMNVSLFAVSALIVTWGTVGFVQLPAEIAALGARFAVSRTLAAFIVSMPVALLTALLVGLLT